MVILLFFLPPRVPSRGSISSLIRLHDKAKTSRLDVCRAYVTVLGAPISLTPRGAYSVHHEGAWLSPRHTTT